MIKENIRKVFALSGYQIYKSENVLYIPEDVMMKAYLIKATEFLSGPVKTVFDIGANIGGFSRFVSGIFPSANVFAFEPISENFTALKNNTAEEKNIHPVKLAFGAKAEMNKKIFLKSDSQWHSLANNSTWHNNENNFENINIGMVDEYLAKNKLAVIDILKTDTEGYDLEVLKGADKALTENKIKVVVCEVGFNKDDIQHTLFNPVHEYLFGKGFRVMGFTGLQASYKIQNKFGVGYCNCIFLNSDK
jgi:FkbM family methyltransferase